MQEVARSGQAHTPVFKGRRLHIRLLHVAAVCRRSNRSQRTKRHGGVQHATHLRWFWLCFARTSTSHVRSHRVRVPGARTSRRPARRTPRRRTAVTILCTRAGAGALRFLQRKQRRIGLTTSQASLVAVPRCRSSSAGGFDVARVDTAEVCVSNRVAAASMSVCVSVAPPLRDVCSCVHPAGRGRCCPMAAGACCR